MQTHWMDGQQPPEQADMILGGVEGVYGPQNTPILWWWYLIYMGVRLGGVDCSSTAPALLIYAILCLKSAFSLADLFWYAHSASLFCCAKKRPNKGSAISIGTFSSKSSSIWSPKLMRRGELVIVGSVGSGGLIVIAFDDVSRSRGGSLSRLWRCSATWVVLAFLCLLCGLISAAVAAAEDNQEQGVHYLVLMM